MEARKTIDMLTKDSVSIKTEKYITEDNAKYPIGQPHRVSYVNSEIDRKQLQDEQPEDIVNAVLTMWGNKPTVKMSNNDNK